MRREKVISSRDFQHHFSDLAGALKPGESVNITRHGELLGTFTKAAKPRKNVDYLSNLDKLGYSAEAGQRVIDAICDLS
jgi:antitoxin (DNA-binding transcriptional repressor) of toxin-antitoxin stability system